MGDQRSVNPGGGLYPYCWLQQEHARKLAGFLNDVALGKGDFEGVSELVILGDLFDDWVCPAQLDPVPSVKNPSEQFFKIADADQNKEIIQNLRKIASKEGMKLTYVPGNHDMLITDGVLEQIVPGIQFMGVSPGEGVYLSGDGIAAEHGSNYCLFNAPDPHSNPDHTLPLGFFITRVVAYHSSVTGKDSYNSLKIVEDAIRNLLHQDDFAKAVFNAIVKECGLEARSLIKMNGIDSYINSVTVSDVDRWFGNIYDEWNKRKGNVPKEEAVVGDIDELYPAAVSQYFMKKRKPDIVIFGHTHQARIHGLLLEDELEKGMDKNLELIPSGHIYANTGTWIDSKISTFVETELSDNNRYHVRLKKYGADGKISLIGERFKDM